MMNPLHVQPGTSLQLHFPSRGEERLPSKLIGWVDGQSVMVTTPYADEKVMLIRQDAAVTVRYFQDTAACAFEAKVLHVCNKPFPYLHLSFPETVECDEVRKEKRVDACLQTTVKSRGGRGKGHIIDLSMDGARIELEQQIGDIGDPINVMTSIPIGNIKRLMTLVGTIRSVNFQQSSELHRYGIQFQPLMEDDYILLNSYINAQLLQ